MIYEPVFKVSNSNVFVTDLIIPAYINLNPVVTIKNGNWKLFLSQKILKDVAEKGFQLALNKNSFKNFEKEYWKFLKKTESMKQINLDDLLNKEFLEFLKNFKTFMNDFFGIYKQTEFFYFKKIESELNNYIKKTKHSLEDVLSNKVDLSSWPEKEKKLARYVISIQHLKFKYRKLLNRLTIGKDSLLSDVWTQIITRTSREDSIFMTIKEIIRLINGEDIRDCSDRKVYSFIHFDENNEMVISSGGEAYRKIRKFEKEIPQEEIIGTPASKGLVSGKVRIVPSSVNPEKYKNKFKKGEILVSTTTGPEMTVIMEKVSGIVTDEGGLMSHAAIISRELKIPCVVGTRYATEVFKDGDEIELNANNGVVRKITKSK